MNFKKQKCKVYGIINMMDIFTAKTETCISKFAVWLDKLQEVFKFEIKNLNTQYDVDALLFNCTMCYSLSKYQMDYIGELKPGDIYEQLERKQKDFFFNEKYGGDFIRQNIICSLFRLHPSVEYTYRVHVCTTIFKWINDYSRCEDSLTDTESYAFFQDVFSILWYYVEKWKE